MTTQLCPKFAISSGQCEERERLPMSLEVVGGKVTKITALVAEHCEDGLPPRIEELEIPHAYQLHKEGAPPNVQMSFNLRSPNKVGSQAGGWFKNQIGKGGLSFVNRDPEDPTHESYCYAKIGWHAE
jgi:hypothetical protein